MCREIEKLLMAERMQGRVEGRAEATVFAVCAVMAEFSVPVDDAMLILKVPEEDRETYRKLIDQ